MILSYYIAPEIVAGLTSEQITEAVCEWFNIKPEVLFKKGRKTRVVAAKHLTRYLFRYFLQMPLSQIQEYFEGDYPTPKGRIRKRCDHTTVIHSCKTVKRLLEANDMVMCKDFMEVSTKIGMVTVASETLNQIKRVGHSIIINLASEVYERPKAEYSNHTPFNVTSQIN